MVTSGPGLRLDHAVGLRPRDADAQEVGHRRSAGGSELAREHPADDDALADDVRPKQMLAQIGGLTA